MTYEQMIKQAQDNLRISKEERARAKQNGNYQRASKTVVIEGRRRNSYDVNVLFWENRIKELKRLDAEQKERDKERARKKKEKEAKQKADEKTKAEKEKEAKRTAKEKAEKEREAKKRAERKGYSQDQGRYNVRYRSDDDDLEQALKAWARAEADEAESDVLTKPRATDEVTVGRPLSGSGSDVFGGINNAGRGTALKGLRKVGGCVLFPYLVCWWIVKLPFKILGYIFRIGR